MLIPTAASFLISLGVNTHLSWEATYTDANKVLKCLQYLGIHAIRDYAPAANNSNMAEWSTLARGGVNFDFNIDRDVNIPDFIARLNNFVSQYPNALEYVEGPNEIWNWETTYEGKKGMAAGKAVQKALFAATKADHRLATVPVLVLTTGGGPPAETYNLLGNLSAYGNYGNIHVYPQGDDPAPYNYLTGSIPWQTSVVSPSLPMVITEAGYYTRPDDKYGVSENVQAKYTLDFLLDAFLLGAKTTYLYELLDDHLDPKNMDREDHFGLFYTDGKPKPAATALHNLANILADPGDMALTREAAPYTITKLPPNGHSLQFAKASGADSIVIWVEPIIWNRTIIKEHTSPVSNVTVNFTSSYKSVSIYDPMHGKAPIATKSNVTSITLALADHPLIIERRN